jgi:hypothetical protein
MFSRISQETPINFARLDRIKRYINAERILYSEKTSSHDDHQ